MVRWTLLDTLAFLLLLSLLLPSLLIMFIPSTFKRPVSSWKALNLRKTLLMASSVRLKPLNCHVYAEQWIKFMKDGVNATPLPTVNTTGYIDHAAFLGTINPDTNLIPKHLFQGYLNIYNNYFKAPWMPDRTEANPNELNQDDARYGFRCCHLKNIWTAPLPPETELSRQMTTSTTSIDIMGLQAAY